MQPGQPLLTVIIFAYNHEDTIARAIDSVLEQSTCYSYEIWLCEDCSTDATLAVCRQYAERHPGLIRIFAQPVNTFNLADDRNHIYQAFCRVDKKYFCYLDGDDYWCDKEKIQTALDVLENNPEYVTFAHDTLVINHVDGTKSPMSEAMDLGRKNVGSRVAIEDLFRLDLFFHPSARIHRNVIDFSKMPAKLLVDMLILYAFMDKGALYYHDRVMSVYNITGQGSWTNLSRKVQRNVMLDVLYYANQALEFRYDGYFSKAVAQKRMLKIFKMLFGKSFGWKLWYVSMLKSMPVSVCLRQQQAVEL